MNDKKLKAVSAEAAGRGGEMAGESFNEKRRIHRVSASDAPSESALRQWVNRWVLPEARCVALEEVRVLVAENMVKHYGQHDDALLADGFEDALLGFGRQFNVAVAVYDYERCLAVLRDRDGMSEDGALEFFEFNVAGAYVGPHTPIFMSARHGHDRT
jgi:hypothetical protein